MQRATKVRTKRRAGLTKRSRLATMWGVIAKGKGTCTTSMAKLWFARRKKGLRRLKSTPLPTRSARRATFRIQDSTKGLKTRSAKSELRSAKSLAMP